MRYTLTCLTPTLVGDGQKLAPIDYMVWRDQVNVLDQRRIFRLLARGPRLENYLTQIRKAEKLDFNSWGGFAQNFAGRRIPLESPGFAAHFDRARAEQLFIPTFAAGPNGAYVPGSALKGPVRSALLMDRLNEAQLSALGERMKGERPPRYPAEVVESAVLGAAGISRTRPLNFADSSPLPAGSTKIYLLRTSSLIQKGNRYELGWKQVPRGTVEARRVDEATPYFAEMAVPGARFTGEWHRGAAFQRPEMLRQLRWKQPPSGARVAKAANAMARRILDEHKKYAEMAGLSALGATLAGLDAELAAATESRGTCLFCLGWGTGFLSKSAMVDTESDIVRGILRLMNFYARAVQTGMPFPKTRKVLFQNGVAASLPGWVKLELAEEAVPDVEQPVDAEPEMSQTP